MASYTKTVDIIDSFTSGHEYKPNNIQPPRPIARRLPGGQVESFVPPTRSPIIYLSDPAGGSGGPNSNYLSFLIN